jgi:hypothetical protein
MITRLDIENFRGLRNVTLDGLRNVNLIVGGNDTGKTSVLEALVLALGDNKSIRKLPITFRTNHSGQQSTNEHDDGAHFWPWLFYDRKNPLKLKIKALTDGPNSVEVSTGEVALIEPNPSFLGCFFFRTAGVKREAFLHLMPQANKFLQDPSSGYSISALSTHLSNPVTDAECYNKAVLSADGEQRIEEVMKVVDPRVRRLRYAKLPNTPAPLVFVDIGLSQAVPSTQMGQAFNRILHIYSEILAYKYDVMLIDEIENGIFSGSMETIWKGLFAICRQEKVQIFATTHSRECVMAALEASKVNLEDELSVQRLQRVKGEIEAIRLSEKHLELAAEMGLEVRA